MNKAWMGSVRKAAQLLNNQEAPSPIRLVEAGREVCIAAS